jgi:pimeloyl-ACP methyl ester carboxylesterase
MEHVSSADGTSIAYERTGDGSRIVIVNGAMSRARDAAAIAAALADAGFAAVTYDRRARGDSGDTPPVDPRREVEDLAAVIGAVDGVDAVLGHSSGAVLALFAASEGVATGRLFLSEPPFAFGEDLPPADLPERLQQAVDEGRGGDAIIMFQREAVRLPDEMIEQIRSSPMFADLVPLAQSVVYDATLTRAVSTPTHAMLSVTQPVTVLCGVQTFPMLITASRRLAGEISGAELVDMPASVGHRLDGPEAAAVVGARLSR